MGVQGPGDPSRWKLNRGLGTAGGEYQLGKSILRGGASELQQIRENEAYDPIRDTIRAQSAKYDVLGSDVNRTRGQTGQLGQMLEAQARGQGPSVAQQQLMAGLDAQQRQAMSMAASARGPAQARMAAQQSAQQQMTDAGLQTGQQAAILRAQEQQAAMGQYGGMLQRQQELDMALQRGELDRLQYNVESQLNQRELARQREMSLLDRQLALQSDVFRADQGVLEMQFGHGAGMYGIASGAESAAADRRQRALGAAIGAGGTVLGGLLGGPAGAVAGGAAGGALGGSI